MKNRSTAISIALLLSLSMTVISLVGCSDPQNDDNGKTIEQTTVVETEAEDLEFEDADYNQRSFTIISYMNEAEDYGDNYMDNDERTGEPVNDAVIDRNTAVEEKYNISIERISEGAGYLIDASKSGTVDFDLVYDWAYRLMPAVAEAVCYDFYSIPNIKFEQDYWAPETQQYLTVADKMLITTSDISMNRLAYAGLLVFNKALLDRYNLEYPYALVDRNEWTYDKYMEYYSQISEDVNGNTLWDIDDIYGTDSAGVGGVVSSAGINSNSCLIKNEDGGYTVKVYSEKLQQIYEKYKDKFRNDPSISRLGWEDWIEGKDISAFDSKYQAGRVFEFGSGRLAFCGKRMAYIPEMLRVSLDFQFGVVPYPKYQSTDEFITEIDTVAPMFVVPRQAQDMEFVGTILEYMSYISKKTLLPAYYEQTIKTKCMSDPEGRDEKMLDIVRHTAYYSTTSLFSQCIFKADGGTWNPPGEMLSQMLSAGNFKSIEKKYQAAAQKSIDDFYDWMLEMDVDR